MLPGAFTTVTDALSSAPDVLLVGEVERDVYGKDRRPDAGPRDRPVMRNRIVRREHYGGIDALPDAHLDEVRFASAVLSAAATVEQVDTPVLAHRILPTRVVRQWTDGDPWYAGTSEARPRVARPKGTVGLHDVYAGVKRARRPAAATVRRVARRVPRSRTDLRKAVREAYYAAERRKPLDPQLAVFAAYWGAAYSCNPRAIYEKAAQLVPWLRGVWVVKAGSEQVVPSGVEHVVEGSREYYRADGAGDVLRQQRELPERHRQAAWPGAPADPPRHPAQDDGAGPGERPAQQPRAELQAADEARRAVGLQHLGERVHHRDLGAGLPGGTYESLETGYPRNDVLANATAATAPGAGRARNPPGQKAVLYTPTHREYSAEYVAMLDLGRPRRRARAGLVVLMRAHYFYGGADSGGGGRADHRRGRAPLDRGPVRSPPTCWSPTTRR